MSRTKKGLAYRFFPAANYRQDEIWEYTYEKWGKKQADKYIINLHKALGEVASDKNNWKSLGEVYGVTIYFFRYEKHYLFFKELTSDKIGVISILHESMDLPQRLKEDLEKR